MQIVKHVSTTNIILMYVVYNINTFYNYIKYSIDTHLKLLTAREAKLFDEDGTLELEEPEEDDD